MRVTRHVLILGLAAAIAAPPASAAQPQCAPKPDDPAGLAVTAVGADRVPVPATTPAIAILDSGVTDAPEFSGRLRDGLNVVTGGRNTADLDGHGSAVASVAAAAAGGVRGVSPTSPLIPIKILDARGETSADDVV